MMTNTNYSNAMVELAKGMNQSIDELVDYCMKQFDVKDIFSLDDETLGLLRKSMELSKQAQDYVLLTAKTMQEMDLKLNSITEKLDILLSK
jgi:hypothetical protein